MLGAMRVVLGQAKALSETANDAGERGVGGQVEALGLAHKHREHADDGNGVGVVGLLGDAVKRFSVDTPSGELLAQHMRTQAEYVLLRLGRVDVLQHEMIRALDQADRLAKVDAHKRSQARELFLRRELGSGDQDVSVDQVRVGVPKRSE